MDTVFFMHLISFFFLNKIPQLALLTAAYGDPSYPLPKKRKKSIILKFQEITNLKITGTCSNSISFMATRKKKTCF